MLSSQNWKSPKLKNGLILALGGGGARGLAHIGVICELERRNLKPDLITGSSMGSVVGCLYAMLGNAGDLEKRSREIIEMESFKKFQFERIVEKQRRYNNGAEDWNAHFKRLLALARLGQKKALLSMDQMMEILQEIFGDLTFEDLAIPFGAIATDLISGEDVELYTGKIVDAVAASSAIPGVFEPVAYDGMLLVDGCVTKNIPIPVKRKNDNSHVIAVDVQPHLHDTGPFPYAISVLSRADKITQYHLNQKYLELADEVISPEVRHINWADFQSMDYLIDAGKKAVIKHFG